MDNVTFSESSFEAYEGDGELKVMLTLQRSTDSLHNVSVQIRTRDLIGVDTAQGVTYVFPPFLLMVE